MKKAKKVLSFLTAAMMLGGIAVPAEPVAQLGAVMTAQAADATSGTCGENLTWEYDETTKTLTISGTGEMEDFDSYSHTSPWYRLEFTSAVIGDGVTSIGDDAFAYCYDLSSVTIPDGVTSIDAGAFWECTSLTSVTIPDSVTSIGSSAFRYCFSLTSVKIPDGVTSIAGLAFYGCSSLKSVTIPDSVTSIDMEAFCGCYDLTSITIPDSVTSIGDNAFNSCASLTSVTIPDGVTSIRFCAFSDCASLTAVTIENPNCEIYDSDDTFSNGDDKNGDAYFDGTIYGYENSTAQAYAEKYGYKFESLGGALGDVTGDDVINAGDAAMTLSAAAAYGATGSYGTMTEAQIAAADIDGNSMVNASDAAYILQYAAMRGANGKDFDIRELVK